MFLGKASQNQLQKSFHPRDLARHGLKAEYVGSSCMRISRNGKYLGQMRKSIGTYGWYPAGSDVPLFRAFAPAKALDGVLSSLGGRGRPA